MSDWGSDGLQEQQERLQEAKAKIDTDFFSPEVQRVLNFLIQELLVLNQAMSGRRNV